MPAWNRNEPIAEKRRTTLFVFDIDGAPAPAWLLFDGENELLFDKGDSHFVAPGGVLINTDRPLVIADDVITAVDHAADDTLTLVAHGLSTGDGPIQFTTTGGLPAGLAVATNYWVVRFDVDKIRVATTLALALTSANTGLGHVNLTSAGTGVNTLVDTANTKRLNDGSWIYQASQAELNYRGNYSGIRIAKPGVVRDLIHNVDMRDEQQLYACLAQGGAAGTLTLDVGASATNDFYRDAIVIVVGGAGAGQQNTIASYVGASKVATMARNWAINPDATSQIVIVPAPSGANPSSVAAAVWAAIGEGVHTYGDLIRILIGAIVGTTDDYTTDTIVAKSLNGAKVRVTWTVDETGRKTAVIGDAT